MIVICEPMCWGFEHASVNAALIGTVADAFQDEELLFLAEAGHTRYVKNILDAHSVVVKCRETTIPPRTLGLYVKRQRFASDFRLYRNVFHEAHKNHANKIIFCSVMSPGLISIKALIRRYRDTVCLAVLHHVLQEVTRVPPRLGLFFWLRLWLSIGNTHRLRYVVLGPRVEERLKRYVPRMSSYMSSIDLPYYFSDDVSSEPFADDAIRFGSYGVGSFEKGTDIFFRLAEEVQAAKTTYKPTFTQIGHISKRLKDVPHGSVNVPSPDVPLDQQAYEKYCRNIDYNLFFYNPSAYELRASAAILDAFSFLKPIIALKSPLSEYYFKKMGDIGYLCENANAMKDTVLDILETRPIDRYLQQQENILTQRVQFSPAGLSLKFRSLL